MIVSDPQSPSDAGVPGQATPPAPQIDPTAGIGLDSMRLPPNPLSGQQAPATDYEARYKGLDAHYQKEKQTWMTQQQALMGRLEALEQKLSQAPLAPAQSPQAPAAPSPTAQAPAFARKAEPPTGDTSELYETIAQMEAERYRDNQLLEYTQPGKPGQGLPLFTFRNNIRAVAPDVDENGRVNDTAQRAEIDRFIQAINSIAGSVQQGTQQAMVAGFTPGAAPGPAPAPSADDEIQEYRDLMALRGDPKFDKMPDDQQKKIERRFYELYEKYWMRLGTGGKPFATMEEVLNLVNMQAGRLNALEGMLKK